MAGRTIAGLPAPARSRRARASPDQIVPPTPLSVTPAGSLPATWRAGTIATRQTRKAATPAAMNSPRFTEFSDRG